ncbi:MAG: NUDIX hydrolase [Thermoanaerobaculia bacterium]
MTNPYTSKRMPRLTVDSWVRDRRGRVLLVRRAWPPFEGRWGLPGGFCEWKETTQECCARETLEETGLTVRVGELRGVYSKPNRDPRGHNVTVLYAARRIKGTARGGDDAAEARWFEPRELGKMAFAFDHREIVMEQLAKERDRARPGGPTRGSRASPRKRGRATPRR